jgi:hypothetical protein
MSSRKRIALAVLSASLLVGSYTGPLFAQQESQGQGEARDAARATDAALDTADEPRYATLADTPPDEEAPFGEKYYPVAVPGRRRPLMSLLDRAGIAEPLDNARIRIFGHVEGSYTHNFEDPALDLNLGRVFDIEDGQFLLNQLDLNVERTVALSRDNWDVGGRVEMMYGSDARFIHSNGVFDHHSDDGGFIPGPENQFDLTQAYVDVAVPVGSGLRVRAGKFLFFKQLDPNASVFYYRTAVDLVGSYRASDKLTFMVDAVYGRQANPFDELMNPIAAGSEEADWYGLAGYAIYEINDYVSAAGRLEWFRDEEGFTPVTAVPQDLFEATIGLTIQPFPHDDWGRNLKIRPEVRYDWSTEDFFDGLTSDNQLTAAVDVIFNF